MRLLCPRHQQRLIEVNREDVRIYRYGEELFLEFHCNVCGADVLSQWLGELSRGYLGFGSADIRPWPGDSAPLADDTIHRTFRDITRYLLTGDEAA